MRVDRLPLVLAAIVLAGCASGPDPIIDSWPVGGRYECSTDRRCDELIRVGLAGIDKRDPDHAAVTAVELHSEGTFVDPVTGNKLLMSRSGSLCVLVVRLDDGGMSAIGVGYPGVSQEPMAFPWEMRPGS
jgi:hypothetical protein